MPLPKTPTTGKLPPGRHGLPRHFVVHSQRERLVRAVAETVAEEGYAASTIGAVVRRANVSRRTFYEHFADKDAALLAAYDAALEQLFNVVIDACEQPENWRERIRAGLDALLTFLTAEPAFARMAIVETACAGAAARERHRNMLQNLRDFFEHGRPQPEESPPPDITLRVMVGGMEQMIHDLILDDRLRDLPKLRPAMMYLLVAPFYGVAEAQRELDEFADWSVYDLAASSSRTAAKRASASDG